MLRNQWIIKIYVEKKLTSNLVIIEVVRVLIVKVSGGTRW